MKLDIKRYPILNTLEDIVVSDEVKQWINKQAFKSEVEHTLESDSALPVQFISKPVLYHLEKPFMYSKLCKFTHELTPGYGYLLTSLGTFKYGIYQDGAEYIVIVLYAPIGSPIITLAGVVTHITGEKEDTFHHDESIGIQSANDPDSEIYETESDLMWAYFIKIAGSILPFLSFAETETVVINKEHRHSTKLAGEKYMTDLPIDIEIVDSSWFTEIIRTEGFNVSGHFRLQPYGLGSSLRRLQWISPYEKHGYHRLAKKDN